MEKKLDDKDVFFFGIHNDTIKKWIRRDWYNIRVNSLKIYDFQY